MFAGEYGRSRISRCTRLLADIVAGWCSFDLQSYPVCAMDQREDASVAVVIVSMLCTPLLLVEDVGCLNSHAVDRRAGLITVGSIALVMYI